MAITVTFTDIPEGMAATPANFNSRFQEIVDDLAAITTLSLASVTLTGTLTLPRIDPVSGAGLGINTPALDNVGIQIGGAFTSGGASTASVGVSISYVLTGAAGDTSYLAQAHIAGNIATQGNSDTIGSVAGLRVDDPVITVGTGDTVTTAASLLITGAPTEGTYNYALYVDAGATGLDGGLQVGPSSFPGNALMRVSGAYTSSGNDVSSYGTQFASNLVGASGDTGRLSQVCVSNGTIATAGASDTIGVVSSLYVDEPFITNGGGDTITIAASVYIQRAPTEGSKNYALCVDDGAVRIDQGVALGGGASATLGTIGGSGPASAGQAQWLQIDIGGTTHWVPAWT